MLRKHRAQIAATGSSFAGAAYWSCHRFERREYAQTDRPALVESTEISHGILTDGVCRGGHRQSEGA